MTMPALNRAPQDGKATGPPSLIAAEGKADTQPVAASNSVEIKDSSSTESLEITLMTSSNKEIVASVASITSDASPTCVTQLETPSSATQTPQDKLFSEKESYLPVVNSEVLIVNTKSEPVTVSEEQENQTASPAMESVNAEDPVELIHTGSSTTSILSSSSKDDELSTYGTNSSNEDGPIDIDTGSLVLDTDTSSVPDCVKCSTLETEAMTVGSYQEHVSAIISAMSIIPGIGKMFAFPSQEACNVDRYMEDCSIGESTACDLEDLPRYYSSSLKVESVALDPGTDPFAARVGKTLVWRNVNMTLQTGKGQPNKKLLTNVWGEVPKTETTAIMGASGAGKTSLLNILAGRARSNGRLKIEADVRLNNYAVDPTNIQVRKSIAFVAQDDSLQATATPREAIRFSAKLRLPRSTTEDQLDKLASRMINELGLSSCADTIVGGPLIKGISGGERRRASIGVELVVKPAMVFLDEPTSGLDSFSAVQVCQVLKKVAQSGAAVLFTIHQPSSEIFDSFDHLILLQKGRVLYQGPVSRIPKFFAAHGYPCPTNYNPADWVVNVAQRYPISELEEHGFFPEDERTIEEALVPGKGQDALGITMQKRRSSALIDQRPPGVGEQVRLLFKRELVYMYRFPYPLATRFGLAGFLSGLIGMIFFKVGETSSADTFNLQSQFGALMILLMLAMLGTAQPALLFFPEERPIFLREYSTDHYSVLSYFLSRLCVEAVTTGVQVLIMVCLIFFLVSFRGSFAMYFATTYTLAMSGTAMAVMLGVLSGGNGKIAQQLLPLVFIPQLLFSGFFVSPDLIPKFLRWAQYVCVLTYAVRMLIIEEFYNCSDNYFENMNCNMLVANVKAVPGHEWYYWIVLVVYFLVFRLIALLLLRKSATKFY